MSELNGPKIINSHSFNYIKNEEGRKSEIGEENNLQTTQKRGQPKINISRLPPGFANQKKKKQIEPLITKKDQKQQVQQNIQNIEAIQEYKQVSQMLSPLKRENNNHLKNPFPHFRQFMKDQKKIHEELSLSISTLVQSQLRIEDMITTGILRCKFPISIITAYADSSPVKKMLHAPTMKLYVVKEEALHNKEIRKNLKDWISFWQSKCSNSIQHVQIYSTFWSTPEGYVSIVMEYMNGGSLQNLLESMGVLPERSIRQLVQPILQGLQRIHQSGAQCHGALGPSQILFLRDGTVKLGQGLQYRVQIQGNQVFNQYILGRGKEVQSLYDPNILETPSLWSKAPSEKYYFSLKDEFVLERANDIWKLGWLLLNCAIGTMEFHPKAQQIYEGSRIILEEITKYIDILKDTCCLLHSEIQIIQIVEKNSKIINEPTKITILDLLPSDKFSVEFIDFLCSTLKIDPRQRQFTEQLLQHQWLTGGKECKGPNVQLKELLCISNAWNTSLPEEYQGQGAQKLERLCDALCLVLQNSEKPTINIMQLQENSPIIKELSYDMGINAKVVSGRLIKIFQTLI